MTTDRKQENLTALVFEHYIQHHELVLKKLTHAQEATKISLKKVEAVSEQETAETLEKVWSEIVDLFEESAASEEELFKIEETLGVMPTSIKELYDTLIEQDQEIQDLVQKMSTAEYLKAMKVITKVQDEKNPMSGLTSKEYETEKANEISGAIQYKARFISKEKEDR